TLSGSHTFFLEEMKLKPGDFVSYYAKARDNNSVDGPRESTSDIYFMEVRPFDHQFRQAQQQGGGSGGGEDDSNALTRRQREIIAATFRVQREETQYKQQEKDENYDTVRLSQNKLKTDTDALTGRIKDRLGNRLGKDQGSDYAKLVEYLLQASKEMDSASGSLGGRKAKEALPPEQRALQQLLRAEAIFRDIQVANGQQGQGKGSQNAQELADLFELQLDKMKNQYETVQRQQQASQNEKEDELSRRLQELARRQQQQVEQRMRSQMQQAGGNGGGSPRDQQQLIDEAKKMARELERLSRDRRNPQLEQAARQLEQGAEQMQQAQNSGRQESTANQLRALSQLQQAQRLLEAARSQAGEQSLQALRQKAEDALRKQNEIEKGVQDLARSGKSGNSGQQNPTEQKAAQIGERNAELANQIE